MSEIARDRFADALPSASELIVENLVPEVWFSAYRDDFLKLFLEAYRAYLSDSPRASIIVAGESLLRVLFARIESEIVQRAMPLSLQVKGRRAKTAAMDFEVTDLAEYLTFCEAIDLLKQNNLLPAPVLDIAYTVKDLRNRAAHGQFPLLDDWDPDDPRPPDSLEYKRLLRGESITSLEGYRFISSRRRGTWFTFDCRMHYCGSIKQLGIEGRYAAIQYCLVTEVLLQVFNSTIRAGDRVRRKGAETTGTVVESIGYGRISRDVRWDSGEVESNVRISDIEKVR